MTDKTYYQAAAVEVAAGHLDVALWTKVNADLPESTDVVKQAKYIQLRTQEIERDALKETASRAAKTTKRWLITSIKSAAMLAVVVVIISIAVGIFNSVDRYKYAISRIGSGDYNLGCENLGYAKNSAFASFAGMDPQSIANATAACDKYRREREAAREAYGAALRKLQIAFPVLDPDSAYYNSKVAEEIDSNTEEYISQHPQVSKANALIYVANKAACDAQTDPFSQYCHVQPPAMQ